MITEATVIILFAIVAVAIVAWVGIILPDLREYLTQHKSIWSLLSFVFNATPDQEDAKRAPIPLKVIMQGIIPIVLWLLIIIPLIVFPIILIVFPLLNIPWSYLLPPVP